MGKTLNLISPFSGKVGSVIGAVRKGSKYPQILRQYQPNVANPKTLRQQRQRYLFATVVQAMSSLYDIVNHSFENVKYGQVSLNYFQQQNLNALRGNAHMNYLFKGNTALVPNEYLVAKGSLEEMKIDWDGEGRLLRSITINEDEFVTCGAFLQAFPDFKPGDQLTVCYIIDTNETAVTVGNIRQKLYRFRYDRAITSVLMGDNLDGNFIGPLGFNQDMLDMALTTDSKFLNSITGTGVVVPGQSSETPPSWLGDGEQIVACCLIHSQQDSRGNWLRSTARMSMDTALWNLYTLESAIESYTPAIVDEDIENDRYLNNATEWMGPKSQLIDRPLDEVTGFGKVGDDAFQTLTKGGTTTFGGATGTKVSLYWKGIPEGYHMEWNNGVSINMQTASVTGKVQLYVETEAYNQLFHLVDAQGNRALTWTIAVSAGTNP